MSIVDVKIGSRSFQLACENGQEHHLQALAQSIDEKVHTLGSQMGTNNDALLLVMSALMTQDELNEAKKNIANFSANQSAKQSYNDALIEEQKQNEAEIAEILNSISTYLENLADKVEKI
jgi:cell division protein ZapA